MFFPRYFHYFQWVLPLFALKSNHERFQQCNLKWFDFQRSFQSSRPKPFRRSGVAEGCREAPHFSTGGTPLLNNGFWVPALKAGGYCLLSNLKFINDEKNSTYFRCGYTAYGVLFVHPAKYGNPDPGCLLRWFRPYAATPSAAARRRKRIVFKPVVTFGGSGFFFGRLGMFSGG